MSTLIVNVDGEGAHEVTFTLVECGSKFDGKALLMMSLCSWMSTHGGGTPSAAECAQMMDEGPGLGDPDDDSSSWVVIRSSSQDLEMSWSPAHSVTFELGDGEFYYCEYR